MSPSKILLLVGATSDIGHAIALRYAQAGWGLILAARDPGRAERTRADIAARTGIDGAILRLDLIDTDSIASFVESLPVLPDTIACVVGDLGDQARAQSDARLAAHILQVNFNGPALLLGTIAERFAARGHGTIVGVSSVAGDRGRGSNYVYGSAKAGLTAFLSGLRNRLASSGIRVVTVKPGFVRTRMTRDMKLPARLTAEPDEVGQAVFAAAEGGRADIVYVRPIWRVVMTVIGLIPERIFKRLRL